MLLTYVLRAGHYVHTPYVEGQLLRDANGSKTDRHSRPLAALWWLLALAYPFLVVVAASRPEFGAQFTQMLIERLLPGLAGRQVHVLVVAVRKSGHFLGYSLFATILANAFLSLSRPPRSRRSVVIVCLAAAVTAVGVAAMDEYIQLSVAFRSGSRQDVLVDSLGVLTALAVWIRRTE